MEPVKIFISYSHDDFKYMEIIRKSLAGKEQNKEVEVWTDEKIIAGEDYDLNIKTALEKADIILFLISVNFISSWYIANIELQKAVDRHNQGLVKLIPIVLEDCDYKNLSLFTKEPLPMHQKRLRPVNKWSPRSAGYHAIVKGLDIAIADLKKNKRPDPSVSLKDGKVENSSDNSSSISFVDPKHIQLLRHKYYINNEFGKIITLFKEIEPKIRESHINLSEVLTSLTREWNELRFKEIAGDVDWEVNKRNFSKRLLACIYMLEKEFTAEI